MQRYCVVREDGELVWWVVLLDGAEVDVWGMHDDLHATRQQFRCLTHSNSDASHTAIQMPDAGRSHLSSYAPVVNICGRRLFCTDFPTKKVKCMRPARELADSETISGRPAAVCGPVRCCVRHHDDVAGTEWAGDADLLVCYIQIPVIGMPMAPSLFPSPFVGAEVVCEEWLVRACLDPLDSLLMTKDRNCLLLRPVSRVIFLPMVAGLPSPPDLLTDYPAGS